MYSKIKYLGFTIVIFLMILNENVKAQFFDIKDCTIEIDDKHKVKDGKNAFLITSKGWFNTENSYSGTFTDVNKTNFPYVLIDTNLTKEIVQKEHLKVMSVKERPLQKFLIGESFFMTFSQYNETVNLIISSCNETWKDSN
jgi:hypothetical protein